MVRRPVLAMFAVVVIVLGGVVVSTPAGAVVDSAVVVPSPNPGTSYNFLSSVSCVSVSFCVATGIQNSGSSNQPLYETLVVSLTGPVPPTTTTTTVAPEPVIPAFTG